MTAPAARSSAADVRARASWNAAGLSAPRVELNEAGYAAITAEHTGAVTANGAP